MKFYLCIVTICLGFIIFVYYYLLQYSFICSNYEFEEIIIPKLCQNVTIEAITFGLPSDFNLCDYICSSELDIKCHILHLNKQYVFTLSERKKGSTKVVIKSVIEQDGNEDAYWEQKGNAPYIPTTEELNNMVSSHVEAFVGKPVTDSLNPINSLLLKSQVTDLNFHGEFWKFIYDHEFLLAYLFHNYRLFPKILGTCQTFYALEYAEPLIDNPLLPVDISRSNRIGKAIELLDFIVKFDFVWEEPIHLCDIKHDHFGWTNNDILFLDLDCVVTDSSLNSIMAKTPECSSHEDCSFFDCSGECLSSKKCAEKRTNSNLQVLCRKIFLGHSKSSIVSLFGLLNDYEFSDDLKDALTLCSTNPGMTAEVLKEILHAEFDYVKIPSTEF